MINHAVSNDVTLGHYVGKGEAQLRAGWQTVADFIESAAAEQAARPTALVNAPLPDEAEDASNKVLESNQLEGAIA